MSQNSTIVFDGIIFKIYQWRQKLFDGSTKIYERAITSPSVMIIPTTPQEQIILIYEQKVNSQPKISLPKGFVKQHEDLQKAAHRELLEETGYNAQTIQLYKKTGIISQYFKWELYFYVAKGCNQVTQPTQRPGERILELRLVDFDTFLKLIVQGKLQIPMIEGDFIRAYYDKRSRALLHKIVFQ